jgi:hypothetical protein
MTSMTTPCTNGHGEPELHDAKGWLCDPDGQKNKTVCAFHAGRIIEEYAAKLGEAWTFEVAVESGR